jgi:hypothetical protein
LCQDVPGEAAASGCERVLQVACCLHQRRGMTTQLVRARGWMLSLTLGLLAGCESSESPDATPTACGPSARNCVPDERPSEPGTPVALTLASADQQALDALRSELTTTSALDAATLLTHAPRFNDALGYDPTTSLNLQLIQGSELSLDEAELDRLKTHGFAISKRHAFPNMAYGYKTIYALDLPVYVSLDSILDAVHLSYDKVLQAIELDSLRPDLLMLLRTARARLANGAVADVTAEVKQDLDFYFAVALGLLEGKVSAPVAGADANQVADFVTKAAKATGIQKISLFGVPRTIDFSQFEPRGHYTDSDELKRYFRAMMWLGRVEFRLIETKPDGSQVFNRRQLDAALAMRALVQGESAAAFARIDTVVSAFVGEHDYMQLKELDLLLADLGTKDLGAVKGKSDAEIAKLIVEKGYGAQRIASQVIFKDPGTSGRSFPLDRSFALLGQRYVVDSHIFSNVVYDRVLPDPGKTPRYLPDPLDVAYAALGNRAALPLLEDGLEQHGYAPELEQMRQLVDAHGESFWDENLYNLWLSSLRAITPRAEGGGLAEAGMPAVTRTEAWSRRLLNTQLGSWAQLRHDTILYAKQSYTSGDACEFPDAYVDPYPEAFGRLAAFAEHGEELADVLVDTTSGGLSAQVRSYFVELGSIANILRDMAEQQRKGVPFNAAQMAFINEAVTSKVEGCAGPETYSGWYARLLFNPTDDMDPAIADVHTDPGGDRAPMVLHVGTGLPRLMVVTADTCSGPRAYAGLAFAYHEVVTGLDRLTDPEWAELAPAAKDVPWMEPLLQ